MRLDARRIGLAVALGVPGVLAATVELAEQTGGQRVTPELLTLWTLLPLAALTVASLVGVSLGLRVGLRFSLLDRLATGAAPDAESADGLGVAVVAGAAIGAVLVATDLVAGTRLLVEPTRTVGEPRPPFSTAASRQSSRSGSGCSRWSRGSERDSGAGPPARSEPPQSVSRPGSSSPPNSWPRFPSAFSPPGWSLTPRSKPHLGWCSAGSTGGTASTPRSSLTSRSNWSDYSSHSHSSCSDRSPRPTVESHAPLDQSAI